MEFEREGVETGVPDRPESIPAEPVRGDGGGVETGREFDLRGDYAGERGAGGSDGAEEEKCGGAGFLGGVTMNEEIMSKIPKRELQDLRLALGQWLLTNDNEPPSPSSQHTRVLRIFNRIRNYMDGKYINDNLTRPVQ